VTLFVPPGPSKTSFLTYFGLHEAQSPLKILRSTTPRLYIKNISYHDPFCTSRTSTDVILTHFGLHEAQFPLKTLRSTTIWFITACFSLIFLSHLVFRCIFGLIYLLITKFLPCDSVLLGAIGLAGGW
jgi:hypothetical protein